MRIFVIKKGEQAMKKKLEVCLELQRGQEIVRSNYIKKKVSGVIVWGNLINPHCDTR